MSAEKSKVYFGSVQHGNRGKWASFATKVDEVVKKLNFKTIEKKDKVAIKMHLGFSDGYQTIPVFFVRRIVKAVKAAGGFPYVTDNPTSVYNAVDRGYTQETCGCPIIPVAGVKDNYVREVDVNFRNVDKLHMAGALVDADVLIDLTHFKGHDACGFGGAVKNIALGGYSKSDRWYKIHGVEGSIPYWDSDKCTPEHAKKLVKSCKQGFISYDEKKHQLTVSFGMCNQCMDCFKADENVKCLSFGPENFALFPELMTIAANEILKTFDEKKRFFISFLTDITPTCDCWGIGQPQIVNDIGILGSRDIVAIEAASLDLIAKEGLLLKKVPPMTQVFEGADLHPFQRIHGPMKDPYWTVEYAEKLGMGSRDYKLIELLSPKKTMKMKSPKTVVEDEPTFM